MKKIVMIVLLYSMQSSSLATNEKIIFAGGCFWCMEPPFDKLNGVISTATGYSGGHTENPSYKSTSEGDSGHYEAIQIEYDPGKISYEKLLDVFWQNIDPFDARGQFCDKGLQYRAVIFFNSDEHKHLAIKSKEMLRQKTADKAKIVTEILPAKKFYAAEEYHQNYYQKNPLRYKYYRFRCGRDKRLKQIKEIIDGSK